jgi:2-amino-4-hydroxy-6-hydroxymethyldihydropteridine diphosphokinase
VTEAFVAIGSNTGNRLANLTAATRALAEADGLAILAASHVYESEPWGVLDQPAFANAVLRVEFTGQAESLLAVCQDVEKRLGRVAGLRFGPRVIDIDILLFGDESRLSPSLTVPHPRMLERDFVVTPLLEVAPWVSLPDGTSIARDSADQGRVTGVLGPLGGFEDVTPGEHGDTEG